MKMLLRAAALLLVLAGCNRKDTPPDVTLPTQSVTPVPRPAMNEKLGKLFPGSTVAKLASDKPGEFFDIKKKGKPPARAALMTLRDGMGKELQVLVVTRPDGKIKVIAAGLANSAGQTEKIFRLNNFLRGFIGKNGSALAKYSVPKELDKVAAKTAVDAVKGALDELGKSGGNVGE